MAGTPAAATYGGQMLNTGAPGGNRLVEA